MGKQSAIEWTRASWNPWVGCDRVSAGCMHCYAARWAARAGRPFFGAVRRTAPATFDGPLRWREPLLVFTCSLGDFFHPQADAWRDEAWEIVRRTPHLLYQVLTKRPEFVGDRLPEDWPLPNVWLGVSVEQQRWMNRLLHILKIPAAGHFLSAEPLLGPLAVYPMPWGLMGPQHRLDWVMVGGESGPQCRPMDPSWARDLVAQCRRARVPVFLKQLGGHPDKRGGDKAQLDDALVHEYPAAFASLRRDA